MGCKGKLKGETKQTALARQTQNQPKRIEIQGKGCKDFPNLLLFLIAWCSALEVKNEPRYRGGSSPCVCGVFYSTQQGSSLQWHFHLCPTHNKPLGTSGRTPLSDCSFAALSRLLFQCIISNLTGFLWTRLCEHNGTKSPRKIQGSGSWPSPMGEATQWEGRQRATGTAVGDSAAKHREGHPWGSRGDDSVIEETLNEHISKFCPLALAVSLGSCQ